MKPTLPERLEEIAMMGREHSLIRDNRRAVAKDAVLATLDAVEAAVDVLPIDDAIAAVRASLTGVPPDGAERGRDPATLMPWCPLTTGGPAATAAPLPPVTATVREIRRDEDTGALESTDLYISGRGVSLLVNVLAGAKFTFALSVDDVACQHGTVGAADASKAALPPPVTALTYAEAVAALALGEGERVAPLPVVGETLGYTMRDVLGGDVPAASPVVGETPCEYTVADFERLARVARQRADMAQTMGTETNWREVAFMMDAAARLRALVDQQAAEIARLRAFPVGDETAASDVSLVEACFGSQDYMRAVAVLNTLGYLRTLVDQQAVEIATQTARASAAWSAATDETCVGWHREMAARFAENMDIQKHCAREAEAILAAYPSPADRARALELARETGRMEWKFGWLAKWTEACRLAGLSDETGGSDGDVRARVSRAFVPDARPVAGVPAAGDGASGCDVASAVAWGRADDRAVPGTKMDILDALHAVLTSHGIASRASTFRTLVTDLVHWAADACRQSTAGLPAPQTDQRITDESPAYERIAVAEVERGLGSAADPVAPQTDDTRYPIPRAPGAPVARYVNTPDGMVRSDLGTWVPIEHVASPVVAPVTAETGRVDETDSGTSRSTEAGTGQPMDTAADGGDRVSGAGPASIGASDAVHEMDGALEGGTAARHVSSGAPVAAGAAECGPAPVTLPPSPVPARTTLERYGIPNYPDGYWTPWHVAADALDTRTRERDESRALTVQIAESADERDQLRVDAAECIVADLQAQLEASDTARRTAEQERDKWLDAFNRSEQFQSGPITRAEKAEQERAQAVRELVAARRYAAAGEDDLLEDAIMRLHDGSCRKHIYDRASSPCTCVSERERQRQEAHTALLDQVKAIVDEESDYSGPPQKGSRTHRAISDRIAALRHPKSGDIDVTPQ